MNKWTFGLICLLLLGLAACQGEVVEPAKETGTQQQAATPAEQNSPAAVDESGEPERIVVQHILISFKGSIPKPEVTRTREEAETLAAEILERAQAGEDFPALVKEYTDDQFPGIYGMSNLNVEPDRAAEEFSRAGMVKAFGDVSFSLKVGEVGTTTYDEATSKYGWHIIKRLK
jgi:hypothetical protein